MLAAPDYWVIDAMASYAINDNLNVQLNGYNLTDEDVRGRAQQQRCALFARHAAFGAADGEFHVLTAVQHRDGMRAFAA